MKVHSFPKISHTGLAAHIIQLCCFELVVPELGRMNLPRSASDLPDDLDHQTLGPRASTRNLLSDLSGAFLFGSLFGQYVCLFFPQASAQMNPGPGGVVQPLGR